MPVLPLPKKLHFGALKLPLSSPQGDYCCGSQTRNVVRPG